MVIKDYYSLSEASEILGKSKETLRRWDKDGRLNAVREPVSNYRVYRKEDINSLIKPFLTIHYQYFSLEYLCFVSSLIEDKF